MARPITFPHTAAGEWTNHETSIKIVRGANFREVGLYYVMVPVQSEAGWFIVTQYRTLNEARRFAKRYVEITARPFLASEHNAALVEEAERILAEDLTDDERDEFTTVRFAQRAIAHNLGERAAHWARQAVLNAVDLAQTQRTPRGPGPGGSSATRMLDQTTA